jgi:cyanophycin synthetase
MKIRELRVLNGPNAWDSCPVLEIVFDEDAGPAGDDGAVARAHAFVDQVRDLQEIAGTPVGFAAARRSGSLVIAAVEFAEEPVARAALEIAGRLEGASPSAEDVTRLKDLPIAPRLSATVATTYLGAKRLGIPVAMLSPEYGGYLVLGQGSKQHRVRWSEPDAVSGVARLASTDKYLTNQLLRSIGIPVPHGKLISSVEEAWPAAEEVGLPVAVKPYNTDLQTGVSLDVRSRDAVEAAFRAAAEHSSWVLVEHFAPGIEHRVVVVGDRVVAVCRIDPPKVIGDGASTIVQLVDKVNQDPRRGEEDSDGPCYKLKLDDVARGVLAAQGCTLESVPAADQVVLVRRDPPYFKNGGNLTDLTDVIHPTTAAYAVAAARMMQIPVAGLDVVAVDIARPLAEQEGILVEINSNPGFWLHLAPWADSPRPVGEEMVRWLFRGGDGRIPVVAIVGDDGSVRCDLEAKLTAVGLRVGVSRPGELSSAGRSWPTDAKSPQERAFVLLRNPEVDVVIVETDGEELRRYGFACDRCDVAVRTATIDDDTDRAITHALSPNGIVVTTADGAVEHLRLRGQTVES